MDTDPAALEAMPMPENKAELLERIPPARTALEQAIAGLSDARMVAPGHERWSVKDHLVHLATWERLIVAHLRTGAEHELLGLDPDTYAAMDALTLNEYIYQRSKDLPLADVLTESAESHAATLALLAELSDEGLERPYWSDDPDGRTALEKIAGDTYRHYLEHRRWIMEMMNAE